MGSFSSSSLSSSNRGLKAYLTERQTGFTSQFKKTKKSKKTKQPTPTSPPPPYLWLLADGRHRNMMTNRMMENKKRQNASSIHSSLQSCRRRHRETFLMKAFTNPHLQEEKRLKMKHVLVFSAGLNERIYKNESNLKM